MAIATKGRHRVLFANSRPGPIFGLGPAPMMLATPPHPLHGNLLHRLILAPAIHPIPLNDQILFDQSTSLVNKVRVLADNCALLHLLVKFLTLFLLSVFVRRLLCNLVVYALGLDLGLVGLDL